MKKLTALLLAGVMAFGMSACGNSSNSPNSSNGGAKESGGNGAEKNEAGGAEASDHTKADDNTQAEDTGGEAKTYTISFNTNNGNTEDMPKYQFLSGNMSGMIKNDSRIFVDISLELDGVGNYDLKSDGYVIEGGKRATVGDETGIGLTLITTATGSYEENDDGTVTIRVPGHATHELASDTYSSQMKDAAGISVAGSTDDGKWDSDEEPSILELVPETVFTLDDSGKIVTYEYLHPEDYESEKEESEDENEGVGGDGLALGSEVLTITSDDEGTTFMLTDNGTYEFAFADYGVSDIGSYIYDADTQTLTITDANGSETVSSVDGDHVVFHYVCSQSDQLTGDYTIDAAKLAKALQ